MKKFMQVAIAEAEKGLRKKAGGPFGAVIVLDGKLIASAHNEVIKNNDPTCHAEIQAIRAAAKKLKRFDLSDCEIYSSCEPCPMCLAAIHWAKIRKLYFGATRKDAEDVGFDDKFIYDVICGTAKKKQVSVVQISRRECLVPLKKWLNLKSKTQY
ncbi:MAG: nucleoside deaminase [Candidatus Peribacteraceae bacterium]|nr:nucleoside deaminase [Candidatus Peribacteraceae bacterium]